MIGLDAEVLVANIVILSAAWAIFMKAAGLEITWQK
jgi:hypothetical protein